MSAVDLTPAEQLALTIARGQLDRGEPVTPNVAQVLALAFVRAVDTKPDDGAAVHLLTGPMPRNLDYADDGGGVSIGGQLLVTVWGNGQGEVAWREVDDTRMPWGPPETLTPAP